VSANLEELAEEHKKWQKAKVDDLFKGGSP
jgi:hypothetical protein